MTPAPHRWPQAPSLPVKDRPTRHFRRRFAAATLTAITAITAITGCEYAEESRKKIVERHRKLSKGHVGVLRGLEVHERAVQQAQRIHQYGDGRCTSVPQTPFEATLTIKAQVVSPGVPEDTVIDSFEEVRTIHMDNAGNVFIDFKVTFNGPAKHQGGQWTRQERLVGKAHFVKEQNLPFVSHRAHKGDAAALLRRTMDPIPALLASGDDRWRPLGSGDTFVADQKEGARQFRCGFGTHDKAWVRRFLERTRLDYAEATLPQNQEDASERRRHASARFLVGQAPDEELSVRLDVDEKVFYRSPTRVEAPQEVVPIRRERYFNEIHKILTRKMGIQDLGP